MDKRNSEFSQIQRKISSWTITSALVIAVILLLFNEKSTAKGLLLGTIFSISNFILLGKSVTFTLGRSRSKASIIGFASILTRYLFLAAPLIIAIKSASFDFIATVFGIFAVQLMTLIHYVIIRPIFKR